MQDWTYYDNGQLKTVSTKNGAGAGLESHDLTYTYTDTAGRDGRIRHLEKERSTFTDQINKLTGG